jgi:hypothetical protein
MCFLLPISALAASSPQGYSIHECKEQLSALLKRTDSIAFDDQGFSACKALPTDRTLNIVALANLQRSATLTDSFKQYDLDVLLIRNKSGRVVKKLSQKDAIESDAVALRGIAIDTARYQLTSKVRAFGVQAYFTSNSHSYSASYTTINLYVSDGNALKEVLSSLVMNDEAGSGDFDFVDANDICTGTTTQIKRTLAIAKTTNHGYADILVTEKKKQSNSNLVKSVCKTTPLQSTKLYTLQFDGNVYVVPKELIHY